MAASIITAADFGPAFGEPGPHGPSQRLVIEALRMARVASDESLPVDQRLATVASLERLLSVVATRMVEDPDGWLRCNPEPAICRAGEGTR